MTIMQMFQNTNFKQEEKSKCLALDVLHENADLCVQLTVERLQLSWIRSLEIKQAFVLYPIHLFVLMQHIQ